MYGCEAGKLAWFLEKKLKGKRSPYPQQEQDQMKKTNYGLDWLQKSIWYGLTKLYNKLPRNVRNIRWRHKFYRENLARGIDSGREKLSWNKNPK